MKRPDSAELKMTLCYLRNPRQRYRAAPTKVSRYPFGFRPTVPQEVSDG